jgi:hypothetical protein
MRLTRQKQSVISQNAIQHSVIVLNVMEVTTRLFNLLI